MERAKSKMSLYKLEYKQEAVRLVQGGHFCAVAAKILGMPKQTLAGMLRLLAKRWLHLTSELKELDATLEQLTAQTAKCLRSQFGVGPQTVSTMGYISPIQFSKTVLRHR